MKTRSTQPLIQLENTTVLQHGIPSLKNVSWSIFPGQQWAVLGANGSGKSALAAALCGLAFTAAGEITYSRAVENAVACVSFQLQRAFCGAGRLFLPIALVSRRRGRQTYADRAAHSCRGGGCCGRCAGATRCGALAWFAEYSGSRGAASIDRRNAAHVDCSSAVEEAESAVAG